MTIRLRALIVGAAAAIGALAAYTPSWAMSVFATMPGPRSGRAAWAYATSSHSRNS